MFGTLNLGEKSNRGLQKSNLLQEISHRACCEGISFFDYTII